MALQGAAAAQVASALINTVSSAYSANRSAEYSKELSKYVNTHKHQWEVADLRAAGLNPILSATNGSALSGGSVNVTPADVNLDAAINTSINEKNANSAKVTADATKLTAETGVKAQASQEKLNDQNSASLKAQADKVNAEATQLRDMLPYLKAESVARANASNAQAQNSLSGVALNNILSNTSSAQADLYRQQTLGFKHDNHFRQRKVEFDKDNSHFLNWQTGFDALTSPFKGIFGIHR